VLAIPLILIVNFFVALNPFIGVRDEENSKNIAFFRFANQTAKLQFVWQLPHQDMKCIKHAVWFYQYYFSFSGPKKLQNFNTH
jgi:hypothetical protein